MSGVDERETPTRARPAPPATDRRRAADGGTGWPTTPAEIPLDGPTEPLAETETTTAPPVRHARHSRNPVDRLTRGLPDPVRVVVDWAVTIIGAIAIVLLVKAFVVNPYRIPSSSMEPTLHCARPASGCEARFSDRVLANRFIYHLRDPRRGEIIVFDTPDAARLKCGAGGTFVKRLIGLPGDTVEVRLEAGPRVRLHQRQAAAGAVSQGGQALERGVRAREGGARPLLHDGRQPRAIVRLPRVGNRAPEQPDRQGVRDLLAARTAYRFTSRGACGLPVALAIGPRCAIIPDRPRPTFL